MLDDPARAGTVQPRPLQAALAGRTVRKVVVVPGRIVNIVAG